MGFPSQALNPPLLGNRVLVDAMQEIDGEEDEMLEARLRHLLEQGADPNAFNDVTGDKVRPSTFHDVAAELHNQTSMTPLHLAIHRGVFSVVKLLLSHGAKVDETTELGTTALHLAVAAGHHDIAAALVKAGADVDRPIHGLSPLHLAVKWSDVAMGFALIEAGADVNRKCSRSLPAPFLNLEGVPSTHKWTALRYAVHHNDLQMAAMLMFKGSDLLAEDCFGRSVLNHAVGCGTSAMVSLLLNKARCSGCVVNAKDSGGLTPLVAAIRKERTKAMLLLLKKGADVNAKAGGRPPLTHAIEVGHTLAAFYLLLEHQARLHVDARANDGRTALHSAAAKGYSVLTDFLLKAGADYRLKDRSGLTPYDVAISNGKEKTVGVLLQHAVDRAFRPKAARK